MMSDNVIPIQHYMDAQVSVMMFTNKLREVICSCTRFNIDGLCRHVKDVIMKRLDAKPDLIGSRIVVPIYSKPKFKVILDLENVVDSIIQPREVQVDGQIIGIISPGEGRRDLRIMFLEWLTGVIDIHDEDEWMFTCTEQHGPEGRACTAMWPYCEVGDDIFKEILVNFWSLNTRGCCTDCYSLTPQP